jgi:hypothetical protein
MREYCMASIQSCTGINKTITIVSFRDVTQSPVSRDPPKSGETLHSAELASCPNHATIGQCRANLIEERRKRRRISSCPDANRVKQFDLTDPERYEAFVVFSEDDSGK